MRDLRGLGSSAVLTLCTVITVGCLALVLAHRMAVPVAIAVIMGAVGISLLKSVFTRVRLAAAFS